MSGNTNRSLLARLIDAETLYEQAPCGYFSTNPDGLIIKMNRTMLNWLDITEEQTVGCCHIGELFSKAGKIYYQMFHFPLIEMTGQVNEINYDIRRRDGTYFPALVNSIAVRDPTGKMIAINTVVNDITERKRYEQELVLAKQLAEKEKYQFQFVCDHIPEMIWVADENGKINYINKRFSDHFDFIRGKSSMQGLASHIHHDDRLAGLRSWISNISMGKAFEIKLRIHVSSGFEWYLFKGQPYLDDKGYITHWLGSCLNVHSHVTELQRRDEFLGIASHELKTPITGIKLALQLLERLTHEGLPKQYKKLIEQARRSAEKINDLVNDLLNIRKLSTGQLALKKTHLLLSELIERCITIIDPEEKWPIVISGNRSLKVHADEHRIEQVVINFITNAIKYAPQSTAIRVELESLNRNIKVSVIDMGDGIPREKLSHVFQRYYRVDPHKTQKDGLGLGLYICEEIITRHGGEIGAESELGIGSTFWFTLPSSY